MDHYNKLERDSNFICPAADERNVSSSFRNPEFEHQLLRHPDDVSSYNIETIRRMMFDMMQDRNMMTDTNPDTGSIESSFSNHKDSPAHHPNFGGEHELLVPVSRRRTSSVPLYVEVKDSSMTDEGNDDDDVLSVGHLSVVHADSGYEVTSVDLQQMVHHIRSSSPDQFVNHCLQERQRHRVAKSSEYRTSFAAMTPNDEAMMQSMRQSVSIETMHRNSYTTNPRSSFCLPCSDPNSVAYLQEIEPLPFRRPSANNGKSYSFELTRSVCQSLTSGTSEPPPEDQVAESSEVDHQQEVVTTTGDAIRYDASHQCRRDPTFKKPNHCHFVDLQQMVNHIRSSSTF